MYDWILLFEKAKLLPQSVRNNYLITGIKNRDAVLVELALSVGAEVNILEKGCYPIELACKNGCNDEILNMLIDGGADVTVNNSSSLSIASIKRAHYLIKPLVKAGCDVSVNDDIALRTAISFLDYDLIDYLLTQKANINNCYAQIVATIGGIEEKTFESFIHYGLDLKKYGSNFILEATSAKRLDIIKLLVNKIDVTGYIDTLITLAIRTGDSDIVQFYVDKYQVLPEEILSIAVKKGYIDTVRVLIKAGIDVTQEDNSAICLASTYGHVLIANLLLKSGADASARDNEPIRNAHKKGYTELEKLLFSYGATLE